MDDFLNQMRLEFARQRAAESIPISGERLNEIAARSPQRTGLASGKYPELRAVLKTQRALGSVAQDPTLPKGSAAYQPSTRKILANPNVFKNPKLLRELRRHEQIHDIQSVGRQLGRTVVSPFERLTWAQEAPTSVKGGLSSLASELQAYSGQMGSRMRGAGTFMQNIPLYINEPQYAKVRPVLKAAELGRDLMPVARNLGRALGRAAGPAGWLATAGEFMYKTQPTMEQLQNQPSWATQLGEISPPPNLPQFKQ